MLKFSKLTEYQLLEIQDDSTPKENVLFSILKLVSFNFF